MKEAERHCESPVPEHLQREGCTHIVSAKRIQRLVLLQDHNLIAVDCLVSVLLTEVVNLVGRIVVWSKSQEKMIILLSQEVVIFSHQQAGITNQI